MSQIEAIFQDGVFKPLSEVSLQENQHVRLTIQAVEIAQVQDWLEQVQAFQQQIISSRGYLPDSTPDIAADRNW